MFNRVFDLRCPDCGETIHENQQSCPHCGADLNAYIETITPELKTIAKEYLKKAQKKYE